MRVLYRYKNHRGYNSRKVLSLGESEYTILNITDNPNEPETQWVSPRLGMWSVGPRFNFRIM